MKSECDCEACKRNPNHPPVFSEARRIFWAQIRLQLYLLFGGMWRGEEGWTQWDQKREEGLVCAIKKKDGIKIATRVFYHRVYKAPDNKTSDGTV